MRNNSISYAIRNTCVVDSHREGDQAARFRQIGWICCLDDLKRKRTIGYRHCSVITVCSGIAIIINTGSSDHIGFRIAGIASHVCCEITLVEVTWEDYLRHRTGALTVHIAMNRVYQ